MGKATVDKTAIVDEGAAIGNGTVVWAFAQVGRNAIVGENCVLGNACFVDREAKIGNGVKIMNKAQVFRGCEVGNNVFIGPGVVLANDSRPMVGAERKFNGYEWKIGDNASIGANSVILPDVNIGKCALVGAGSIVTRNVPEHGLAYGNPARLRGFVCACREKMQLAKRDGKKAVLQCKKCGETLPVPLEVFEKTI